MQSLKWAILVAPISLAVVMLQSEGPVTAPTPRIELRAAELTFPGRDPALMRRELLARLDARVDEIATQSRLDARLALNEVCPISYLGVDTEPIARGLRLIAVYPDTAAERCGLVRGDVLRTLAGVAMDSKAALGRTVRSHGIGESVELSIERDGRPMTIVAKLGARPEEDEDEDEQYPDLVQPLPPPPAAVTLLFNEESVGTLPRLLDVALGGHGALPLWRVAQTPAGVVLRQESPDPTGIHFPMVIVRDWIASDAVVRVRFRYAGGKVDRAAGIVLRYRDPGNYLVARANAAEGDLRIFRLVNGDRRTLPGAIAKGATDDDAWHELEFRAEGPKLTAVLDGKIETSSYDTFFLRGRVGLWTKSDSLTEFDDLKLEAQR